MVEIDFLRPTYTTQISRRTKMENALGGLLPKRTWPDNKRKLHRRGSKTVFDAARHAIEPDSSSCGANLHAVVLHAALDPSGAGFDVISVKFIGDTRKGSVVIL